MAKKQNTKALELPKEAPEQAPDVQVPADQAPLDQAPEQQSPAKAEQQPGPASANEEPKKGKGAKKPSRFIVVKAFRDRSNWAREYAPGQDVSSFDEKRLEHLVKIGFVEAK